MLGRGRILARHVPTLSAREKTDTAVAVEGDGPVFHRYAPFGDRPR
jgi:hypothetical protein